MESSTALETLVDHSGGLGVSLALVRVTDDRLFAKVRHRFLPCRSMAHSKTSESSKGKQMGEFVFERPFDPFEVMKQFRTQFNPVELIGRPAGRHTKRLPIQSDVRRHAVRRDEIAQQPSREYIEFLRRRRLARRSNHPPFGCKAFA